MGVTRRNKPCKGPGCAWHLREAAKRPLWLMSKQGGEWEQIGLESRGCQAMQGCRKGFGFALSDTGVYEPHHIHTVSQ